MLENKESRKTSIIGLMAEQQRAYNYYMMRMQLLTASRKELPEHKETKK